MERTHGTDAVQQTPLATRGTTASLHRRMRWWRGGVAGAVLLVAVGLAVPPPAAACSWWNPFGCLGELGDYLWDTAQGALALAWDVITLNPEEIFEDFQDIAENQICWGFTPLSLAVSAGVEADFDECASPPHPIEPDILVKLGLYFQSSFDSVRVHEGCNLDGDYTPGSRSAITFGEHIYFEPTAYNPWSHDGFARLAHELTHVLQYRKKGFADFTCEYGLHCAFGANQSCAIEQAAYAFEALVLQDQEYTPDGDFSNNKCHLGETKHTGCPSQETGNGYDYGCDNGNWIKIGGWCEPGPHHCGPASNPHNCVEP